MFVCNEEFTAASLSLSLSRCWTLLGAELKEKSVSLREQVLKEEEQDDEGEELRGARREVLA